MMYGHFLSHNEVSLEDRFNCTDLGPDGPDSLDFSDCTDLGPDGPDSLDFSDCTDLGPDGPDCTDLGPDGPDSLDFSDCTDLGPDGPDCTDLGPDGPDSLDFSAHYHLRHPAHICRPMEFLPPSANTSGSFPYLWCYFLLRGQYCACIMFLE